MDIDADIVPPHFSFRRPIGVTISVDEIRHFLNYVSNTLQNYKQLGFSNFSSFVLDFPFQIELGTSAIYDLISKALQFNINELSLLFSDLGKNDLNDKPLFQLPVFLSTNYLSKMNISTCGFDDLFVVNWSCLKILNLNHTRINRIVDIVEGCPVLEDLTLCDCWGFKSLTFRTHMNLKKVLLDGVHLTPEEKGRSITISVPSVQSLTITGNLDTRTVDLFKISSCKYLNLSYYWTSGDHGEIVEGYHPCLLLLLVRRLKKVPTLVFGTWIIEVLSRESYEWVFRYPMPKCMNLLLLAPIDDRYQRGMWHIIERCHNVQNLHIEEVRTHPSCKICTGVCIRDESKGPANSPEVQALRLKSLNICK